jgi:hypothetical protein
MSKNKTNTLLNERVIRRWGKLANMTPLTENWLEEQDADEDEMAAAEDEVAAGEAEMEAGEKAEASVGEEEAVERIVAAVVDAISDETGVDIEVEGEAGDESAMDDMDAGMDASDALDDDADEDMDAADAAMRDPAMRDPHNRRDLEEKKDSGMKKGDQSKTRADYSGNKDKDAKEDKKEREKYDKHSKDSGARKGDQSKSKADFEEALDLEVIDDEHLTEAVLQRVVERLLRRK